MTDMQNIQFPWNFNIPMIIIAVLLIVFHLVTNTKIITKRSISFFIGILFILFATVSPLDHIGHNYLFSAHMTQHIILLLIVPPLLLMGTDPRFIERIMKNNTLRNIGNILFYPVIAWVFGVGSMWIWHVPALFIAMMHSSLLHFIHLLSLIICGFIFIWPVFTPVPWRRLEFLQRVLYLATACIGCTILGIFLTFSSSGFYTSYINIKDPALVQLITINWGITKAIDQEIGGLIMWVPACIIYFVYILISLIRWYNSPDKVNVKNSNTDL
jgi:cytochrome c oxidase assembly factor CtaG